MAVQRLDKWISAMGDWSRKEARVLVQQKKVTVDGVVATDSGLKVEESSQVIINGTLLPLRKYSYLMMNKPKGIVSATQDNHDTTVLEILPEDMKQAGLFPAGRLDKDTEGLLIITNDGDFAHKMLAPKNKIPKVYEAVLDSSFDVKLLQEAFGEGISIGEGEMTSSALLEILSEGENPKVLLTIYEGMFHQVKRMFARFDLKVLALTRVKIGRLSLDVTLELGQARQLTTKEMAELW